MLYTSLLWETLIISKEYEIIFCKYQLPTFKKYLIFENYVHIKSYPGIPKTINLKLLVKHFGCLSILIVYFWATGFYSDWEVKCTKVNSYTFLVVKDELALILASGKQIGLLLRWLYHEAGMSLKTQQFKCETFYRQPLHSLCEWVRTHVPDEPPKRTEEQIMDRKPIY